jgi:hypothetical protein
MRIDRGKIGVFNIKYKKVWKINVELIPHSYNG